jgi:hypothetical protein
MKSERKSTKKKIKKRLVNRFFNKKNFSFEIFRNLPNQKSEVETYKKKKEMISFLLKKFRKENETLPI